MRDLDLGLRAVIKLTLKGLVRMHFRARNVTRLCIATASSQQRRQLVT